MQVVITGIGLISALGELEETWSNLLLHRSAINFYGLFNELGMIPLGMINQTPIDLTTLTQKAVEQAIRDASLSSVPLSECPVVIGSSRAYIPQWEAINLSKNYGKFMALMPHNIAKIVANQIGSQVGAWSPMAACATGIVAIAQGYDLIQLGTRRVIVGAVEAPISSLTIAGFKRLGILAKSGCYPFDIRREGLVLGEAGAILVLESMASALDRRAKIYGEILGWGLSNDAYGLLSADPSARQRVRAIKDCLIRSKLSPEDIDLIYTHGTGTIQNDQQEAFLINKIFPNRVPIASTKGATGHTLGASGILATAISLMAIQKQIIPPCVGLSDPEFNLNFVTKPDTYPIDHVLCLSFGFGGQNAVMALGKYRL